MNINPSPLTGFQSAEVQIRQQNPSESDPINDITPISLLKRPDDFKQAFFSLICVSGEAFKVKNYERAALALTKCVDMLDLGKNILKEINKFWKLIVYENLACCYHYTKKLSKCNKFCEKIKEQLQKMLTQQLEKENYLKLTRILIKLKFQQCAILSQLQQHQKAFQLCKSTLPMLKQIIQMLLSYIQESSASDLMEKRSTQTVQFSRQVYRFGQGLLNDLLKCLNEPLKGKESSGFYYWQKNPQNNEEQVKKKFIPNGQNNNCKRSILGVSKSSHWIDEFNIGTIMHFSEMNISDFENSIPLEEFLFKDRLYQLVIYCSMAHFTMATQIRLVQSAQQERNQANANPISSQINLLKKYGYEEKSQLFKLSEMYHLRSIDIMARNFKTTVPYITHIIRSYEKHYIKQKKVLEPIAAIVEESALSINQSKDQKVQREDEAYYYNYIYKNQEQILIDKHDYGEAQPCNQLLLQSQDYKPHQLGSKPQTQTNYIPVTESQKFCHVPSTSNQAETAKRLIVIRSSQNLLRQPIQSLKIQEPNVSDEYLKSHRTNKSSSKVKRSGLRQKSSSKMPLIKPITTGLNKDFRKEKGDKKIQTIKNHDYKLKSQYPSEKNKQKERKTIKKQKLLDFDSDKYGEKQIKIKTESCTHIKVVYKKKK